MSIIIFIIILSALIFVHELGHFLVAKKSGIRVDEFAIGFPPKIFSFVKNGTKYALNLIPFGGYVKIFGEELSEESTDKNRKDSFANKSKLIQIAVLSAGVIFNVIFAWILFSISAFNGIPIDNPEDYKTKYVEITGVQITSLQENSPALESEIPLGSNIIYIENQDKKLALDEINPEEIQNIIKESEGDILIKARNQDGQINEFTITPRENDDGQRAIGVGLSGSLAIYHPNIFAAIYEGLKITGFVIKETVIAFYNLIYDGLTGDGSLDNVAGPIGIVGIVDDFYQLGLIRLFEFTAFISINLAILNIMPLPALDGGRITMVIYEAITRKRINPTVANTINVLGFFLLIGLMILITVNDVFRLF